MNQLAGVGMTLRDRRWESFQGLNRRFSLAVCGIAHRRGRAIGKIAFIALDEAAARFSCPRVAERARLIDSILLGAQHIAHVPAPNRDV